MAGNLATRTIRTRKILVLGILLVLSIPVINYFRSWPQSVPAEATNLYQINFSTEWSKIAAELEISGDVRLENFKVAYQPNGGVDELKYELCTKDDSGFFHYWVRYNVDRQVYEISSSHSETWVQFDILGQAERFFVLLDNLDLKTVKPDQAYESYGIMYQGWLGSYTILDRPRFLISNDYATREIPDTELPINGYYFSSYGMAKTNESTGTDEFQITYESRDVRDYFLPK